MTVAKNILVKAWPSRHYGFLKYFGHIEEHIRLLVEEEEDEEEPLHLIIIFDFFCHLKSSQDVIS